MERYAIDEETRQKILDLLEKTQGYEVKKECILRQLWGVQDCHGEPYWTEFGIAHTDRRCV
jgi:hypothetical protein